MPTNWKKILIKIRIHNESNRPMSAQIYAHSSCKLKSVDKVVYGKKSLVPDCNTFAIARVIEAL